MTTDERLAILMLLAFLAGMLLGFNIGKDDIKMCTINRAATEETGK